MRVFLIACLLGCKHETPAPAEVEPPLSLSVGPAEPAPAPPPPEPASWPVRPVPQDGPRVYSKIRELYIYPTAAVSTQWIGILSAGGSARLESTEAVRGLGCFKMYPVLPKGFVCVDGKSATLDPEDPIYKALLAHGADASSPWPYRYGESMGAPKLATLKGLALPAWPRGLQDTRPQITPRSTVAWTEEKDGYLWTSDLSFVPREKVKPYPRSGFRGVEKALLPMAFVKKGPHRKYDDKLVATGETWPRLAQIPLTGKSRKNGEQIFWETKERGLWIEGLDTAIVRPAKKPPQGLTGRKTWIEVAAVQGWLIAYEGETPVFATLISGGKLGAARPRARAPKQPPATTPIGTWPLRFKFTTFTAVAEGDLVHAEMPYSQRFYDKYHLHAAYWHDAFGEPRSGGCVNLSPIDAKWLFEWSEPQVPEGWHAYATRDDAGEPATMVVVHP